jgi:hypothetical protein
MRFFSVMEKLVPDAKKRGSSSEKSVLVPQTVVWTTQAIALIIETMVSKEGKMVRGTPTTVCTVKKMVSKLKIIFWLPKTLVGAIPNMVGTSPTMVEINRCWKILIFNGLIVVSEHGRRGFDHVLRLGDHNVGNEDNGCEAGDHLPVNWENGLHGQEDLLVREDYGLRNRDHGQDDADHLCDFGDHGHGRKENGAGLADHGRQDLRRYFRCRQLDLPEYNRPWRILRRKDQHPSNDKQVI